jgi:hypothetical protein
MIDLATHWFYSERQLSASAAVERMRHALWACGFCNIWLTLATPEPPHLVRGLWGQETFEVEFEPRHFLIIRSTTDHEWLKTAFTRALGLAPHFQYQDQASVNIHEWRMADRDGRWQAMQGLPVYKSLKRLYAMPKA